MKERAREREKEGISFKTEKKKQKIYAIASDCFSRVGKTMMSRWKRKIKGKTRREKKKNIMRKRISVVL